jgi:hypothetical protein
MAHEPRPLLAEEVTAAGIARFIDAANERLQARVAGITPGRHVLACNGHHVPLQKGGDYGAYLAGVRYKASNLPATLHPTIVPVDSLVFDVIDVWSGRAIGGCTYYPARRQLWGSVGNPSAPLPSEPAIGEIRLPPTAVPLPVPLPGRSGRFVPRGSGLGPMLPPPPVVDQYMPYLLDLTQR